MSNAANFQRTFCRPALAVAGLLVIHAGLLAWSAAQHGPTIDEVAHLPAGVSHWQLQRFNLYCVNPPLVRMIAAIPVVLSEPKTDWKKIDRPLAARAEFEIGRDFMEANGAYSFWYFTLARWACIPFSLLAGVICYCWARALYGTVAGLLSVTLWCFCPIILAFAQTITPDVAAASLGLTAWYAFWRWLRQPNWSGAFWAGLFLGLAELTKMTWVILFPLLPLLWLICRWPVFAPDRRRELLQMLLILLLGVYIINIGYAFDEPMERLGDFHFVSQPLRGPDPEVDNRFAGTWLGEMPVPVPKYYLLGMDLQKRDLEVKLLSYLRGEWRNSGWWYYYLYALIIKVPLGTWLIFLFTVGVCMWTPRFSAPWRDELVLLAPAMVVLTFVSSQTGFNHHLRYVLPILPFVYVLLGKAAAIAAQGRWPVRAFLGGALAWSVASSLWVYPHTMSYFNELVGGPSNGHAHLVDSNIDWGQDLLGLKRWLEEHPDARPLQLVYFGGHDAKLADIEYSLPPRGIIDDEETLPPPGLRSGYYAISVSLLRGLRFEVCDGRGGRQYLDDAYYSYFLKFQPVATIGYSIYVYRLD